MKILGISFLSDASASLLIDGKLVAAISEERLNRIKQWYGIPRLAVDAVLKMAGLKIEDIDFIATHGLAPNIPDRAPFDRKIEQIRNSSLPDPEKQSQIDHFENRFVQESKVLSERTPGYLAEIRAYGRPTKVFKHHEAHAATAYFGSGWKDCFVLTADGWGEDGSSGFYRCANGKMEQLHSSYSFDSLGYFYGSLTKALGFIPHRHEGKVLGLAAYETSPKSYPQVRKMVDVDLKNKCFVSCPENGLYIPRFENATLREFVKKYSREDIASSAQATLEEVVCRYVKEVLPKNSKLALAGGIFANVKLNQRLAQMPEVNDLYVFPNMGDGGLSAGSAWLAYESLTGKFPEAPKNMYLGPEPTEQEILTDLKGSGLSFTHHENIHEKVAELLSQNNVVARFSGRMEFGPRALGNRSILYKAGDPSVNEWLNKRLNRSEFMPFAPAIREESAADCFVGLDKAKVPSNYMTITFDCTEFGQKQIPAGIHIDKTARPQVVRKIDNPGFYAVLDHYHKLTGAPGVVNTSFNMHEEPIVCTASDAIRAVKDGKLPYLALGNYLVRND